MQRELTCAAALLLSAAIANAETPGGVATLYFGAGDFGIAVDADEDPMLSYKLWGLSGSVGGPVGANIGFQLDLGHESARYSDDDFYRQTGVTGHLYWSTGETNLGVFAGTGYMGDNQDGDEGHAKWYGIEASHNLGNMQIAGQLGVASHENDHSSLDYTDKPTAGVEIRYFTGNDMMLRGALEYGKGIVHGDPMVATRLRADATFGIGSVPGLYGTVGGRILDADGGSSIQGHTRQNEVFIGLTYAFGGKGSLRDTYGSSVPMISSFMPMATAVGTTSVD